MKFVTQSPILTNVVVKRDRSKDAERKAAKEAFIGQQYTDVELEEVAGNPHKLSEYVGDGHWLLVDMWTSWCGPCRRDMPNVVAAYEKYHDRGLNVIGISLDTERESWVQAITDLDMHWANLSDPKGWESIICNVYKTTSIPDKGLVRQLDLRCKLEKGAVSRIRKSKYTEELRLEKARRFLQEHTVMRLGDYYRLVGLSRTAASLELRKWERDPVTGIRSEGSYSAKLYVLRK